MFPHICSQKFLLFSHNYITSNNIMLHRYTYSNINQFRKMGYVVVNCNKVRHGKRFIVIVTLANKCCIFAKNPRKIKKTVNY